MNFSIINPIYMNNYLIFNTLLQAHDKVKLFLAIRQDDRRWRKAGRKAESVAPSTLRGKL